MRVRDALRRKEAREGFTLVELLIVIAIIAILAAIAIPQFSKYKQRAYVAAMESDAHNIIAEEEAHYAQYDRYAIGTPTENGNGTYQLDNATFHLSKNVSFDGGIANETCSNGPGYKFTLQHANVPHTEVTYNSCNDTAPREISK